MSREIKFRGKSAISINELDRIGIEHKNGWVYGNLIVNGGSPFIVGDIADASEEYIAHEFWVPVHCKSVGQYTCLKDKNGTEIYEGDVWEGYKNFEVKYNQFHAGYTPFVTDGGCGCCAESETGQLPENSEVIGNIYEDKHLLETEEPK